MNLLRNKNVLGLTYIGMRMLWDAIIQKLYRKLPRNELRQNTSLSTHENMLNLYEKSKQIYRDLACKSIFCKTIFLIFFSLIVLVSINITRSQKKVNVNLLKLKQAPSQVSSYATFRRTKNTQERTHSGTKMLWEEPIQEPKRSGKNPFRNQNAPGRTYLGTKMLREETIQEPKCSGKKFFLEHPDSQTSSPQSTSIPKQVPPKNPFRNENAPVRTHLGTKKVWDDFIQE